MAYREGNGDLTCLFFYQSLLFSKNVPCVCKCVITGHQKEFPFSLSICRLRGTSAKKPSGGFRLRTPPPHFLTHPHRLSHLLSDSQLFLLSLSHSLLTSFLSTSFFEWHSDAFSQGFAEEMLRTPMLTMRGLKDNLYLCLKSMSYFRASLLTWTLFCRPTCIFKKPLTTRGATVIIKAMDCTLW